MNKFCPAPWSGIFYHVDQASVCCVNRGRVKASPKEFGETEYVKQLRLDFLRGIQPDSCVACWKAEEAGLQSIRQHMIKAGHTMEPRYTHMELRASNLCNFHCIMCQPEDSSEIAKEVRSISDSNWNEIVELTAGLKTLILTGGEPMIIKRYYELLDNLREDIRLIIYTNCSVYNPKFIEKMLRLKNVKLQLSIDGVQETAEMQRAGCDWNVVRNNVIQYCKLPFDIAVHATMTNKNVMDVVRFVDFLNELCDINESISLNAHTLMRPMKLYFTNLTMEQITIAKNQLEIAIGRMGRKNFDQMRREFQSLKKTLEII